MRIGINPNKDKELKNNEFFHQVIIPVYIPNQENFFKDSFRVLQFCLESLFKTSSKQTFFTIVNNGSCLEVKNYLDDLFKNKTIHEIIHTSNIGKVNAILKGIAGHNFRLITISDADVMFLNNWQSQTYDIFNNFERAGVVSPVPSPKTYNYLTYNIIGLNLFSKKLFFTKTKNPNALIKFMNSLENPSFYNEYNIKKILSLKSKYKNAVIGSGHFVATYKGLIFDKIDVKYTNFGLGGSSERIILDETAVNQGYWRLSTEDNYAYHLGNVVESWMYEVFKEIRDQNEEVVVLPENLDFKINRSNFFSKKLLIKLTSYKKFWKWFFQYKGLSKIEAENY